MQRNPRTYDQIISDMEDTIDIRPDRHFSDMMKLTYKVSPKLFEQCNAQQLNYYQKSLHLRLEYIQDQLALEGEEQVPVSEFKSLMLALKKTEIVLSILWTSTEKEEITLANKRLDAIQTIKDIISEDLPDEIDPEDLDEYAGNIYEYLDPAIVDMYDRVHEAIKTYEEANTPRIILTMHPKANRRRV